MCLRSGDNANDLSVWLQSWLVVVALDFRGEDPPSVWPCLQCSISWTGGLSSLPSRFRDLFHEAVATSAPFFKAAVYQTPVLDLPSPPPTSGTGNLIFSWSIYLKLYSSRVMRDRKESWSHQSLFNFTSVRGNLFCSDLWHFQLTWSPRTTRIQTPALCDCHAACSG